MVMLTRIAILQDTLQTALMTGHRREKICLRDVQPGKAQSCLLSYIDQLEY